MRDPVETLVEQTERVVESRRARPEAVYRLQFNADFTFRDAERIVPYLAELGISHCYASPYLRARPGSAHGYDIVDHSRLNPEVGSEEDFLAWVETMRRHGISHILDVVPNHMGIVGNENAWWNDVLENGPASPYSGYFDIDWHAAPRPELLGRVLLPVLGTPYGEALESQHLRLDYSGGAFHAHYYGHRFPIAPRTYAAILGHRLDDLQKELPPDDPALAEFQSILTAVCHLPDRSETDPGRIAERIREKEVVKRRLAALTDDSAVIRGHLQQVIADFNGRAGEPRSFDLLDNLLDQQAYRLSFWRVASDEINYRRFFDINELAALNMERPDVFHATHDLLLRLMAEGRLAGVRIDHVDGLYDPRQYLRRLQEEYVLALARQIFDAEPAYRSLDWQSIVDPLREQIAESLQPNPPLYVVVEKILGDNERLPGDWPVHGTSGYAFLNAMNGLLVDPAGRLPLTRCYAETIDDTPFAEIAYRSKRLVLSSAMSGELQMLAHQLDRLAQRHRWSRDFTRNSLRLGLREVIACFPVYRSYIADEGVSDTDRRAILRAIRAARNRNPAVSASLFHFVRDTLLLRPLPGGVHDESYASEQRRFAGKFQQVTSPVVAKGIEDTAFYQFNRLVSLNEVGGEPERFGVSPEEAHKLLSERQQNWPRALSATATHDTKRGEDVRARLNVLSERPDEWVDAVRRWRELNRRLHVELEEMQAPDANEEYLLYQTLLGTWPCTGVRPGADYVARIQAYMNKALHEAKVHSSWINPDPAYDEAVSQFVANALDPAQSAEFLDDLNRFAGRIAYFGYLNALAQTLLRLTAPGVPDTYRGCELWDFSLVDPDNRRPVDFDRRIELLDELKRRAADEPAALPGELLRTLPDGRLKMFIIWRALQARRAVPGLFCEGQYIPLTVEGELRAHLFAFARQLGESAAIVVVPRLAARLTAPNEPPIGRVWQDARLVLPVDLAGLEWRQMLTAATVKARETLRIADALADLPVALLTARLAGRDGPGITPSSE